MDMEKARLQKNNKRLLCRLNNLSFGMHGHLSVLLKELNYFFYFKRQQKEVPARLFMQSFISQLKHIIAISRLVDELGGYSKIFDYKNNQVDYYKLPKNKKIFENMAILDGISNRILLKREYLKIKKLTHDNKVNNVIDNAVEQINIEVDILSGHLSQEEAKRVNY